MSIVGAARALCFVAAFGVHAFHFHHHESSWLTPREQLDSFWWLDKSWLQSGPLPPSNLGPPTRRLVCGKPPLFAATKLLSWDTAKRIPHDKKKMSSFLKVHNKADFPMVIPSFLPAVNAAVSDLQATKYANDTKALVAHIRNPAACKKRTHYFNLDHKARIGGLGSKIMAMIKPWQMCMINNCVVQPLKLPFYATCANGDFTCFFKPMTTCPPLQCKQRSHDNMIKYFKRNEHVLGEYGQYE
jgi:hypothetical protein